MRVYELAKELKTDCVEFIPEQPFTQAPSRQERTQEQRDAFIKKIRWTVDYLKSRKRDGVPIENSPRHLALFEHSFSGAPSPVVCYAAYNSLAFDSYGELYPCMSWLSWGRAVGNASTSSLERFWYSREYTKVRPALMRCRDCYLNCQTELNLLFNPFRRIKRRR